jgi:hypothetical protein
LQLTRHLGKQKLTDRDPDPKNSRGVIIIAIPLILSAIFFFGWYSPKFDNNYVIVPKARFDKLVSSGAVTKLGENTYRDNVDSLKHFFDGKQIIR